MIFRSLTTQTTVEFYENYKVKVVLQCHLILNLFNSKGAQKMLRDEDLKCFLPHGHWGEERRHTEGLSLIWNLAPNTAEKASIRNSLEKNLSASYHILEKKKTRKSPSRKKRSQGILKRQANLLNN